MNRVPDSVSEACAATRHVKKCHIDRLLSLGIPVRALVKIGADRPGIGVMPIRELSEGLFEPADDGQPHLIVPVCAFRQGEWFGINLGQFEPIDLIALQTDAPERWLWRTGDGWALGTEHLGQDAPLHVVATPLDWIASAGRALCILDWAAPGWCWELIRSELQLILPNDRLLQRLRSALARHAHMPDMEVSNAA